jgi:phosphoserine phosphatase
VCWWCCSWGLTVGDKQLVADTWWIEDLMVQLLDLELRWQPGARELLADVRSAGIPTALVTTTPRQLADPVPDRIRADLGRCRSR